MVNSTQTFEACWHVLSKRRVKKPSDLNSGFLERIHTYCICHDTLCSYLLNKHHTPSKQKKFQIHQHEPILLPATRLEQNGIWNVLAKNVSMVKVFFAETFQISFRSLASTKSLGGACGVDRHTGEWPLAHMLNQTLTGFKIQVDSGQLWVTEQVKLCWAAAVNADGTNSISWRFLALCLMFWTFGFWVVRAAVSFSC